MENKNITSNVMPEIILFPRLDKVAKFIGGIFKHLHYPTPSEHFVPFENPPEIYTQDRLW